MRNKHRFETDKTDVMNVQFSNHAAKRVSQRGIEPAVVAEIIKYGTRIYKQGKVFHYMSKADIQLFYHKDDRKSFESVIVLTGQDGRVVTTYRHPDAVSEIKRKPKRLYQKPKSFLHNMQVAQQFRTNRNAA